MASHLDLCSQVGFPLAQVPGLLLFESFFRFSGTTVRVTPEQAIGHRLYLFAATCYAAAAPQLAVLQRLLGALPPTAAQASPLLADQGLWNKRSLWCSGPGEARGFIWGCSIYQFSPGLPLSLFWTISPLVPVGGYSLMHAFWIDPDHLVAETYYARREEEWGKGVVRGSEEEKWGNLEI